MLYDPGSYVPQLVYPLLNLSITIAITPSKAKSELQLDEFKLL